MPGIKGDYNGRLKTIKATSDAKLETVAAIDAGANIIGNIDRVATVGHVDGLGTVEHVNRIESLGTVRNIPYAFDADYGVYYGFQFESIGLQTSPGINSGTFMPLAVNTGGKLILDTLGTVGRVKDIDNLGTVGRLETIGMIEAGTISEVGRVGTVGDITHLGSIGNVNRIESLGSVNSRLHAKTFVGGVWTNLYQQDDGLMTSPGKYGANHYPLSLNANHELKTAPATSRKGGVQTVNNKGTAIALLASSTPAIGVIVKAQHENLGTVYVGDSTVDDTHGFLLRRDEFVSFSCQNAGSVYIDASRGTQKVSYLYVNY